MKELQKRVKKFCEIYNLECPLELRILDLVSEMGELAKEIIKSTNYGKEKFNFRKEIENEMGDLFFFSFPLIFYFLLP